MSFCDWLISLSIMSLRFMNVVACVRISFLYKAESCSTACIYHILFIHSSISGHLCCLYPLATVTNAVMNMGIQRQNFNFDEISFIDFFFYGFVLFVMYYRYLNLCQAQVTKIQSKIFFFLDLELIFGYCVR